MRDITKLSGYPRSNVKTRLEQSNYYLASGRFPLQNAIYDNKLPFSRMKIYNLEKLTNIAIGCYREIFLILFVKNKNFILK